MNDENLNLSESVAFPRHKWDRATTNLLESLFKDVLSGNIKDFIIVVESLKGNRILYKSRNGKELASWACDQES